MDIVHEYAPAAESATVANAPADTAVLMVAPTSPVKAADIERLPQLELIATASTGFDHIDLAAAEAHASRCAGGGRLLHR